MFERLTDRARRVIVLAQEEARELGHNYIDNELVLLALLREGEGAGCQVLTNLGVDLMGIRSTVLTLLGGATDQVMTTRNIVAGITMYGASITSLRADQSLLDLLEKSAGLAGDNVVTAEHVRTALNPPPP